MYVHLKILYDNIIVDVPWFNRQPRQASKLAGSDAGLELLRSRFGVVRQDQALGRGGSKG